MLRWLICKIGKLYFSFIKKRKSIKFNRILVLRSGALGDILMTTPFLRALKKKYPLSEVTYITGDKFKEVLDGNENIDRIITLDTNKLFGSNSISRFLYFRRLAKALRKESFDMCFVLDKSYFANLFAYWCGIPVRIGFDRDGEGFANTYSINYKDVKHEIYYYLDLLGPRKVKDFNESMDLQIGQKEKEWAKAFVKRNKIKNVIGIAPGGAVNPGESALFRRWCKPGYIALAKLFIKDGHSVLFVGGPNDQQYIKEIRSQIKEKTHASTFKEIRKSAALISHCKLFVTHDSGPMHLAATVGMPVLSIFGPTNPHKKAPLGKQHRFLWAKHLYSRDYEFYGKAPKSRKEISEEDVSPKEVFQAAMQMLKHK